MKPARFFALAKLDGVAIGAATTAAAVRYLWPADLQVEALIIMPRSATLPDAAGLEVSIVDEQDKQVVSDGVGDTRFAPCLALVGADFRWMPLSRRVRVGDPWIWQLRNTTAGSITPIVAARVREV